MSSSCLSSFWGGMSITDNETNFVFKWKVSGNSALASYVNERYGGNIIYVDVCTQTEYDSNNNTAVDIILENWTSVIASDKLAESKASTSELNFLRGLPYRSLRYILRYIEILCAFDGNCLRNIVLYAEPRNLNKDPLNLIRYYKSIGFIADKSDEEIRQELMAGEPVEMVGSFNVINSYDVDLKNDFFSVIISDDSK